MSPPRRLLSLALRLVVSAALVAVLLSRLDLADMARFVSQANAALVLVTLAAVGVDRCLMAGRWVYLLETLGVRAPRMRVTKIFFLSTFFGSFLPTGVGGDAVRVLSLSRLTSRGTEAVASVAMDRLLGMLSMLLTGLISLVLFYRFFPHPALLGTVVAALVAAASALVFLMTPSLQEPVLRRIDVSGGSTAPSSGWRGKIARALGAMTRYRVHPRRLALVLAMSVGVQLLRVLQAYLLSESMSLGTPLVYFFCFVPLILIITMLPISISGLGTTNLAYVALFGRVGMDPDGAFVLAMLILALGVVGNLPGGAIYALEGFRASESPRDDGHAHQGNLERVGLVESER